MQQVRITNTVYESGAAKYLAGQIYPATDDTLRQVALNNGKKVNEPAAEELEAEAPTVAAEKAEQTAGAGKRAAKA